MSEMMSIDCLVAHHYSTYHNESRTPCTTYLFVHLLLFLLFGFTLARIPLKFNSLPFSFFLPSFNKQEHKGVGKNLVHLPSTVSLSTSMCTPLVFFLHQGRVGILGYLCKFELKMLGTFSNREIFFYGWCDPSLVYNLPIRSIEMKLG